MAHVIMIQAITQTVGVLLVLGSRSPELLEQVFSELLRSNNRRTLLPERVHLLMDVLDRIILTANRLRRGYPAAPADNGETLVLGTHQQVQRFEPCW